MSPHHRVLTLAASAQKSRREKGAAAGRCDVRAGYAAGVSDGEIEGAGEDGGPLISGKVRNKRGQRPATGVSITDGLGNVKGFCDDGSAKRLDSYQGVEPAGWVS